MLLTEHQYYYGHGNIKYCEDTSEGTAFCVFIDSLWNAIHWCSLDGILPDP